MAVVPLKVVFIINVASVAVTLAQHDLTSYLIPPSPNPIKTTPGFDIEAARSTIGGAPTFALRVRDNTRPNAHRQLREVAMTENGVCDANLPQRLLHVNVVVCVYVHEPTALASCQDGQEAPHTTVSWRYCAHEQRTLMASAHCFALFALPLGCWKGIPVNRTHLIIS